MRSWLGNRTPTTISRARRLAITAVAMLAVTVCLRPQLSSALVDRGDASLATSDVQHAYGLYARALWFAPGDDVAAERLTFAAYLLGEPNRERSALRKAQRTANMQVVNTALWLNIGLCAMRVHDYLAAAHAYTEAGHKTHDPRLVTLGGWAYARAGHKAAARVLWHEALALAPGFPPARRALTKAVALR